MLYINVIDNVLLIVEVKFFFHGFSLPFSDNEFGAVAVVPITLGTSFGSGQTGLPTVSPSLDLFFSDKEEQGTIPNPLQTKHCMYSLAFIVYLQKMC